MAFRIKDVRKFELGFWYFCMDCTLTYAMGFTSIVIGGGRLGSQFNFSLQGASEIVVLPYVVVLIAMPVVGKLVDAHGQLLSWLFFSAFLGFVAHALNLFHPRCDSCLSAAIPFVLFGLQFAIYNVVQFGRCIQLLIPPQLQGTAFGILTCCVNIGTTVFPLLVGVVKDELGFLWVDVFFLFNCSLILLLRMLLYRWDTFERDGILQSSEPCHLFACYEEEKWRKCHQKTGRRRDSLYFL